MADLNTAKKSLEESIEHLSTVLAKKQRELEKLLKVQDIPEPEIGTVVKFSRPLAGGSKKYTFVALRTDDGNWAVSGRDGVRKNLLKLEASGNTWDQLLLAIGDAEILEASGWSAPDAYKFYQGNYSGQFYRVRNGYVEVYVGGGKWLGSSVQSTVRNWTEVSASAVRG